MIAMVLGAGRGTRLGALGSVQPKVLVDIGGRPLLDRQLDYLAQGGVQRVVVNAFHLSEAVEEFVAAYRGPIDVAVTVEEKLLGTAGGVRNALPQLGSGAIFVLYGDVLIDEPLRPLLAAHRRSRASATITVYRSDHVIDKGLAEVDDQGFVRRFVEKAPVAAASGLVNAGLYVIEPAILEAWPRGTVADFGADVFPSLLESGGKIHAYELAEPVVDMGTPAGLAAGRRRYAHD